MTRPEPDVLVQTRIPASAGRAAAEAAHREGMKVAGWLRRVVLKELDAMMIPAWISRSSEDPRASELRGMQPVFRLRPVKDISSTAQVFEVLSADGAPEPPHEARRVDGFNDSTNYVWWLAGGVQPWRLVKAVSDGSLVHVTLEIVRGGRRSGRPGALRYSSEKLTTARRSLMTRQPPHDEAAFVTAMHECRLGLDHLDLAGLSEDIRASVRAVEAVLDVRGVRESPAGKYAVKVAEMSAEDRSAFARAVDDLAGAIDREFWAS